MRAEELIDQARWIIDGAAWVVMDTQQQLSPIDATMLRATINLWNYHNSEQERLQLEEQLEKKGDGT